MSLVQNRPQKICDCCGNVVATKGLLFWHKDSSFVTIPSEVHKHANGGSLDYREDQHYCLRCWHEIVRTSTNNSQEKGKQQ